MLDLAASNENHKRKVEAALAGSGIRNVRQIPTKGERHVRKADTRRASKACELLRRVKFATSDLRRLLFRSLHSLRLGAVHVPAADSPENVVSTFLRLHNHQSERH